MNPKPWALSTLNSQTLESEYPKPETLLLSPPNSMMQGKRPRLQAGLHPGALLAGRLTGAWLFK